MSNLDLSQVQTCQHHRKPQTAAMMIPVPPHCNFHTRKELNTLLFRFLAINQILHFKTYFGDLHYPMLGGLMHRCEAGLAPYFQYEDFFLLFPLRLRLRFVTVWTDTSTPVSLSSSSSVLISKSLLFTFFCLHKR